MIIDPISHPAHELYRLITGLVVPRPIALVTTVGPEGVNAAPFSFFNAVAIDPPTILFSIGNHTDGTEKDTLRNIRHTPEFVAHIVDEATVRAASLCATRFAAQVDELAEAELASAPSERVAPPRVVDAPVQMECRITRTLALGDRERHHVVFGEVLLIHLRDDLVDAACQVDLDALRPVGRLGNSQFCTISDPFQVARTVLTQPGNREQVAQNQRGEGCLRA